MVAPKLIKLLTGPRYKGGFNSFGLIEHTCYWRKDKRVAGEEGFEPSHAGIKIRCLNQLGYSPI